MYVEGDRIRSDRPLHLPPLISATLRDCRAETTGLLDVAENPADLLPLVIPSYRCFGPSSIPAAFADPTAK